MARSTIECARCGTRITIFGVNRRECDRLADYFVEKGRVCSDCYRLERREEERKLVAETEKAAELPALVGTEKQVIWAKTLRADIVRRFDAGAALIEADALDGWMETAAIRDGKAILKAGAATPADIAGMRDALHAETSAKWWIDNREFRDAITHLRAVEPPPADEDESARRAAEVAMRAAAELEAKAEATLRPEKANTSLLTEITLTGDVLKARSEGYIEELRLAARPAGLTWDKDAQCWTRRLGTLSGDPIDRAAETAARFLAAGLPVLMWHDEARRRVVENAWTPEQRRWIRLAKGGGSLRVVYPFDEDYFALIKRLKGAKYVDSGTFSVPLSSHEEVVDFADRHGFGITDQARAAITAARVADGHIVTVAPTIPTTPIEAVRDVPLPLAVPENVTIDPDLLDDAAA